MPGQSDDPFALPGGISSLPRKRATVGTKAVNAPFPKPPKKVSDAKRPPSLRIGVPVKKTGS